MVGDDTFGHFLIRELKSHGVDTQGVVLTKEARTALAFVSRDSSGERTFDFYRPPAADLLYRLENLPHGVFEQPAIVHLCSNSLTDPEIAETTLAIAAMAKRAGCLVSMDATCATTCGQRVRQILGWSPSWSIAPSWSKSLSKSWTTCVATTQRKRGSPSAWPQG